MLQTMLQTIMFDIFGYLGMAAIIIFLVFFIVYAICKLLDYFLTLVKATSTIFVYTKNKKAIDRILKERKEVSNNAKSK